MKLIEFEINGHAYSCTPHPAEEGMAISLRLSSTALLGAAKALGGAAGPEGADLSDALGSLAEALGGLLAAPDAPKVLRQILAHTFRDGERLSDPAVFARAYSANYGELYEAVIAVSAGNGFLPGLDTWQRIGKRIGLKPIASVAEPSA